MAQHNISFIGTGQMAKALAVGLVRAGLTAPAQIAGFDPVDQAWQDFSTAVSGARRSASNAAAIAGADVIVLAIKPQTFAAVAGELKGQIRREQLVLSILAGTTLATLTAGLGTERVIRVMPNTPALIGQGAAGFACGAGCTPADSELAAALLGAVGIALPVSEPLLDAVTGLSGSGPAYVYVLIEALSDGGVRMGLPRAVATDLAVQTVLGAAAMVKSTGEHPGVLKDRVASPGGTTIAGLAALEQHAFRGAVIAAVEAATLRARELGKN